MVGDAAVRGHLGGQRQAPKSLGPDDEWWCELAVALGGRSIREWQHAIDVDEWSVWQLYREKRGPFNAILRNDAMLATIAALICSAAGIKGSDGRQLTATDFTPFLRDEPEHIENPTVNDFLKAFGVQR